MTISQKSTLPIWRAVSGILPLPVCLYIVEFFSRRVYHYSCGPKITEATKRVLLGCSHVLCIVVPCIRVYASGADYLYSAT
uniref:Uncharacterized protein n=1 Tax=Arundo donax TaxID=35708 RepID=A0A0A8ZFE9_ARUDO